MVRDDVVDEVLIAVVDDLVRLPGRNSHVGSGTDPFSGAVGPDHPARSGDD